MDKYTICIFLILIPLPYFAYWVIPVVWNIAKLLTYFLLTCQLFRFFSYLSMVAYSQFWIGQVVWIWSMCCLSNWAENNMIIMRYRLIAYTRILVDTWSCILGYIGGISNSGVGTTLVIMCFYSAAQSLTFIFFLPGFELTRWVSILQTACGPGRSATSRPSHPLTPCSSRCHCNKDPPHHPHAQLLPPSDPLTLPH